MYVNRLNIKIKIMGLENKNNVCRQTERMHIKYAIREKDLDNAQQLIHTGIETLDELIGGFYPGELITFCGDANSNREKILLAIFKHICIDEKIASAYFSNHQRSNNDIRLLIDSISESLHGQSGITYKSIPTLYESPAYYDNTPRKTLSSLCNDIRELVKEQNVKIVFIDIFQGIINDLSSNFGYSHDCTASYLKSLAIELGITIIVTSMPNYQFYNREGIDDMKPQLRDLSENGDLNSYSDIVIGLCRPESYGVYLDMNGNCLKNVIEVDVLLNCRGKQKSGRMININPKTLKY